MIPLITVSLNSLAQECKTIDLSAEKGVLHPLRATNQDGLGICHIEQLQRMLKAKMDKNPDLARISLAVLEKKGRDKHVPVDKKKAVRWMSGELPGGTFIDAGNACEAFELVKGEEVCESKDDLFENVTKLNAYDQKKLLDALSLYFDRKERNLAGKLTTDQLKISIEADYETALKECPVDKGIVESFSEQYKSSGGFGDTELLKNLEVRKYLESQSLNSYFRRIIPDIKNVIQEDPKLDIAYQSVYEALLKQEACAAKKLTMKSENMCRFEGQVDVSRIVSLSSLGLTVKDLYRFIDFTMDRDDYFEKALSCAGKKQVIPKDLNCSTISLIHMSAKDTYVQDFSNLISKNLEENTPIGISVCTRFFKNPHVVTLKSDQTYPCGNKKDPDYKDGEGSHAVTIIGKRCVNGKNQFLIHNSWGTGCGYYAKEYECNKKGGFWVDEEIIARNARLVNILK